uniref:Uncharacterized protein LOC114337676 n=1 Tax=Diabrotica virgifera virgifera TaxID=50390 RepID=A0A6P7GB25_DIAVI
MTIKDYTKIAENDDELAANKGKDTEENDDDEEDDDKKENTSRDIGEARKKKKKKKRKFLAIFLAVVAKLGLLVKLLQAGLLLKLALTTVAILGVSVAKLIFLVKHGKQKTIYYENSHHDHHYEHDDIYEQDDHHHGWGRSANAMAYSKQIPKSSY